MLRNNALFLEKATEEDSSGAYKPWVRINTHCRHLKTNFKQKCRPKYA